MGIAMTIRQFDTQDAPEAAGVHPLKHKRLRLGQAPRLTSKKQDE
jgi:hypothetical protein